MFEAPRWRCWVHRRLNAAVNRFGSVPVVGAALWWVFGRWQRLM